MEELKHFSHEHMLHLVKLQPEHDNKNSDQEDDDDRDEDEDKNDIVVKESHFGECKMCEEEIYSFHQCYYTCNDCDYSLHKFCAELPKMQQNHPLHPHHSLKLEDIVVPRMCYMCKLSRKKGYRYYCSICEFFVDIICVTTSVQKMDHPSHPHQLQRYFGQMMSRCNACGDEHSGTFYHCTTCSWFKIHLSCALLPAKLSIQQSTNENFSHSHSLTLSYSFTASDIVAKFLPSCRVCDKGFHPRKTSAKPYSWIYRCDKCRYYVHVDCATSMKDAFMSSILMPAGSGKTYKNFKDEDHSNLIHCPFDDENVNLLTHHFINKRELDIKMKIDGDMFGHPHPLVLFDGSVSLHDPMKKVELLCDGCVRPITNMPFYKCSQRHCDFVLHKWCTMLPSQIQEHPSHPEHPLVFIPKTLTNSLGLFLCKMCMLFCNGFAYGCIECDYYVDIHCGFIPDEITHEAHPNHLLLRFKELSERKACKACNTWINRMGFYCPTCDFYLDAVCALLLPRTIRHKYDKHPLSLRYYPAENHSGEYFCEICEDEFNPNIKWFYHCSTCAQSMHTACAPLKLQCERSTVSRFNHPIFQFLNVKFGRRSKLRDHPHPVTFVQGIKYDGQCIKCDEDLQYYMIFKCFECKFAVHFRCVKKESIEETSDTSTSEETSNTNFSFFFPSVFSSF